MQQLKVKGGIPLCGEVKISGSKHSALTTLGSLPLLKGTVNLNNVPQIRDVKHLIEINRSLGVNTTQVSNNEMTCQVGDITFSEEELWRVPQLRSSILYLGSILVRCGYVTMPTPGGDKLGYRSIREFLYVLDTFSIKYSYLLNKITAHMGNLEGNRHINLCSERFPLMGNNRSALAIMLAYANQGVTNLKNVLILPELVGLCQFLQLISGGSVAFSGVGTDELTIISPGIKEIHRISQDELNYWIEFDKCELAFWIAAAALTRGIVTCGVNDTDSRQLNSTLLRMKAELLDRANIPIEMINSRQFRISCAEEGYAPLAFDLLSMQHETRGIAFDACPILSTILLKSDGRGSFYCYRYGKERIRWARQLHQIGAVCNIVDNTLFIEGRPTLYTPEPIVLEGNDIRGAACVLLCALATEGAVIYVSGTEHIERAMENIIYKIKNIGGIVELT